MEQGDEYVLKTAALIRANEAQFAQAGTQLVSRSRRSASAPVNTPQAQTFSSLAAAVNPLAWIGMAATAPSTPAPAKRLVLSLDTHHLFYLLMRCEALGIAVGSLDVTFETPFRPTSHISNYNPRDRSDTISIASFRSTFSSLSLGSGLWGRPEPPSTDNEVKFVYSAFTRLPALSLHKPDGKVIAELADDPPHDSAIPLDAFKSLQSFETMEIDPMTLMGWDHLALGLRSLTMRRTGLDNFTDLFVDAVLDDEARRKGEAINSRKRQLRHSRPRTLRSRAPSFAAPPPPPLTEDEDEEYEAVVKHASPVGDTSNIPRQLKQIHWAFLKHLSLADNALTSHTVIPFQHLTSLTHLDLSSNLFESVPSGLAQLYNLVSLNLSDNTIESVLGIYTRMGQVLQLNMAHNRLDSLCGLERLAALERVDLRGNRVDESAEVGRLAVLPNIAEVWVEGNPFYEREQDPRVRCFEYFAQEGKSILLDGSAPGFYERRQLTVKAPEEPKRMSISSSPRVVAVSPAAPPSVDPSVSPPSRPQTKSPPLQVAAAAILAVQHSKPKPKKRKHMRIVQLDGEDTSGTDETASQRTKGRHSRGRSDVTMLSTPPEPAQPAAAPAPPSPTENDVLPELTSAMAGRPGTMTIGRAPRGRHSRFGTDTFAALSVEPPLPAVRHRPGSTSNGGGIRDFAVGNGSSTISGSMSKSAARRARVSASVYEPSGADFAVAGGAATGSSPNGGGGVAADADAFRAKIEALRNEVGDSWLKVLAQSQFSPKARSPDGGAGSGTGSG